MIAATPTGIAEREELLVGHLRRDRLAVEAPALAEEEVAGVDDLLHLAERLGVRLADLARDERGERLLVRLDEPADVARSRGRARARARRPTRVCAARAARQASTNVAASPSRTSATTSAVWRGWSRSGGRRARRARARRRRSRRRCATPAPAPRPRSEAVQAWPRPRTLDVPEAHLRSCVLASRRRRTDFRIDRRSPGRLAPEVGLHTPRAPGSRPGRCRRRRPSGWRRGRRAGRAGTRRSARVSPSWRITTAARGRPSRAISARDLESGAGCARGSRGFDRGTPGRAGPCQPSISLWSCSGSSPAKAARLAFSLIWVFQR